MLRDNFNLNQFNRIEMIFCTVIVLLVIIIILSGLLCWNQFNWNHFRIVIKAYFGLIFIEFTADIAFTFNHPVHLSRELIMSVQLYEGSLKRWTFWFVFLAKRTSAPLIAIVKEKVTVKITAAVPFDRRRKDMESVLSLCLCEKHALISI